MAASSTDITIRESRMWLVMAAGYDAERLRKSAAPSFQPLIAGNLHRQGMCNPVQRIFNAINGEWPNRLRQSVDGKKRAVNDLGRPGARFGRRIIQSAGH